MGFPGGTSDKEPACQCRRPERLRFDSRVGKIFWGRTWQPTPVFLPRDSHGQRSYSTQNHKESNMTEGCGMCVHMNINITGIINLMG